MRKILNNNNKSKRLNGHPKGKIGTPLNIQDKTGKQLLVGDFVKYNHRNKYEGRLLFDYEFGFYGIALSSAMYGDNEYDVNSYGELIEISLDNGLKMNLEKVEDK